MIIALNIAIRIDRLRAVLIPMNPQIRLQDNITKFMFSKEQIQSNRLRIRNNMKVCLVTPSGQAPHPVLGEPGSPLEARLNGRSNRGRRMSQDLSLFQKGNKMKEIYISENFTDLFVVGEKLGEGAQSVVKKCTEVASGKVYAVKMFRCCDTELFEMLKTQYKLLTSLSHSHIIEAFYLFANEKQMSCQVVLEYSPQSTLAEAIAQTPLSAQQSAVLIANLVSAVAYLHRNGVCHRDIKPENIMYNRQTGDIKLIDFEIAKACRTPLERCEMWTNTGTLAYKAPEMFSSGYNELVDIWAIGVVAYELLAGKMPFLREFEKDTIMAIKNLEPEYPEWLPPAAGEFLQRCLEKNPLLRATAHELLHSPLIQNLTHEEGCKSPLAWKNKSCEAKSRRDSSDTMTEQFAIRCFPVTEEEETSTAMLQQ